MEEAILGRGDGQMGLSCLFKALSSLFCCQLESVLYWQDDLCFLVKPTRAPFEYSWRGVNIEGPRTVRCQCFSNFWSSEAICLVLGRLRWPRWQDIYKYIHIYLRALSFLAVIWYCLVLQQNTTKQGHGTWLSWKMEIPTTEEVQRSKIANQMSKSHHNPRLLSNKVVQIEECSANTWMSIMHPWLAAMQATHDNEEPTTTSFYLSSSRQYIPKHSCYWRLLLMFLLGQRSPFQAITCQCFWT